jgi:hypothetical protein
VTVGRSPAKSRLDLRLEELDEDSLDDGDRSGKRVRGLGLVFELDCVLFPPFLVRLGGDMMQGDCAWQAREYSYTNYSHTN